jgi:hypothetical protein
MNYPRQDCLLIPCNLISSALHNYSLSSLNTEQNSKHTWILTLFPPLVSRDKTVSKILEKKCYYKSQQINKIQNITFSVPDVAILNIDCAKYNVCLRAKLRHFRSQCKYVTTIATQT